MAVGMRSKRSRLSDGDAPGVAGGTRFPIKSSKKKRRPGTPACGIGQIQIAVYAQCGTRFRTAES